jgi:methionyl-tRNA formyltransferase
MKVVFFGTPEFSAEVLSYLIKNGIQVVAVITKPDRPKGRSGTPVPTPVKIVAESLNPPIPYYQPAIVSAPEFADVLPKYDADLFVVVAYGEIIKQHLLDMPKLGCINVHTSLLPKYRGAAPIQRSIIDGELVTGVTVMHMVKKMDAGDIIKQVEVPIEPNASFPEIESSLCKAGCEALLQVMHDFEKGQTVGIPQNHEFATLAPKIELEDCEIVWSKPAQALHNLVRGVFPEPGAWCYVTVKGQKKRLKINATRVISDKFGAPGEILGYGKQGLIVACGSGSLNIVDLQLEGKKAMPAEELMRGIPRESFSFLF